MAKYLHETGSLPFLRHSKLCFIEWIVGISLRIYGWNKKEGYGSTLALMGFLIFMFSFVVNEIVLNIMAYTI